MALNLSLVEDEELDLPAMTVADIVKLGKQVSGAGASKCDDNEPEALENDDGESTEEIVASDEGADADDQILELPFADSDAGQQQLQVRTQSQEEQKELEKGYPVCQCGKPAMLDGVAGASKYFQCKDGGCKFFQWADGPSETSWGPGAAEHHHPDNDGRRALETSLDKWRASKLKFYSSKRDSFACQSTLLGKRKPAAAAAAARENGEQSVGGGGARLDPSSRPQSVRRAAVSAASNVHASTIVAATARNSGQLGPYGSQELADVSSTASSSSVGPASAANGGKRNHNEHITRVLSVLQRMYKIDGATFKDVAVGKAIGALSRLNFQVRTKEQVRGIYGVGTSLEQKIVEILETGDLQRLATRRAELKVIDLFSKVWGAGPKTSRLWYQKGYRTLDDLRAAAERNELNDQQLVGLRYYDDLQERMSRDEVERIIAAVARELRVLDQRFEMVACGSYRRGKETCGDVDILITHPDGRSHNRCLTPLLDRLHANGFLVADLAVSLYESSQSKYMGVCKLPQEPGQPATKHRRLDLITVPRSELACALLYFTGSGYFNRSMRHYADQIGMTLSQHSLAYAVRKPGTGRISKGQAIPCKTEEDVFDKLGLRYVKPHLRDPTK